MDKSLQFWVHVACEDIKRKHPDLTKRQLVTQILREYAKDAETPCGVSIEREKLPGKRARGF
jgi:hypothetical protein